MTSTQHSPGPWWVSTYKGWGKYAGRMTMTIQPVSGTGHTGTALAWVRSPIGETEKANARLIAEAPAMLDALYQYRDDMRHPPASDSRERRVEMIESLLARIHGSAG